MEHNLTPNALCRLLLDPSQVMAHKTHDGTLAAATLVLPSNLRRYLLLLSSLAHKWRFDQVVCSAAYIEEWHLGQFSPFAVLSRHTLHHARNRCRLATYSRLH